MPTRVIEAQLDTAKYSAINLCENSFKVKLKIALKRFTGKLQLNVQKKINTNCLWPNNCIASEQSACRCNLGCHAIALNCEME
jgi:hypothetical protein